MPKKSRKKSRKSHALTHVDSRGRVKMVNISEKPIVRRLAVAHADFIAKKETLDLLERDHLPKGEALATARIAAIAAAKRCDELIPLCHSLPLDAVDIDITRAAKTRMRIQAAVTTTAKTGVEMEALLAVSIAGLTLYDMCKAVDKTMRIEGIRLMKKIKSQM
ncbi:MAG TPA: cyclic pyranopterin monophosphate synthase MoaC [Phycisphaerales bacterium]|nr:cyclic pyranopterin monophosphate synthase MoaC [Phycisphaerales bacterium]